MIICLRIGGCVCDDFEKFRIGQSYSKDSSYLASFS